MSHPYARRTGSRCSHGGQHACAIGRFAIVACALAATAAPAPTHAEELPAPEAASRDSETARRLIQEAIEQSASQGRPAETPRGDSPPADAGDAPDTLLVARSSAEVAARQLEAKRLAQRSPADALALLDETTAGLEKQPLPAETRAQLLRRIERTRRDIEESTGKRRAELALERQSGKVEAQIDRERAQKVEVDQRIAMLVEEYNTLIDTQRFAEAEAIAKKAGQLAPDNPVVRQLLAQSRVIRRIDTQRTIENQQNDGFLDVVEDVDRSGRPFAGPIAFPEVKEWDVLTRDRKKLLEGGARVSAAEVAIHRKLDTKVKPAYRNQPLATVIDALATQADVAIHLDLVGLDQEAVRSDTPVTLSLDQPISLKSALKLLLEPLHLGYVVKDEVLKITSPRLVMGDVYAVTYPVADLVLPIPNFTSDGLGITGALRDGYSQAAQRNSLSVEVGPPPVGVNPLARPAAAGNSSLDAASLAQVPPRGNNAPATGTAPAIPFGSPGAGGRQTDFQSLIDLIQSTIAPTTWDVVGGNGAIKPFETNLSLVVNQTQEVHEKLADLLEQLRRLQDLQVTIEVRFITLNDTFFERIGVDFDFNIQSTSRQSLNMTAVPTQNNSSRNPVNYGIRASPGGPTQLIGLDNAGNPGVALGPAVNPGAGVNRGVPGQSFFSIPFRQNSFGSATVPSLPGLPDPATSAANFGFAILSDIEAYFLIQAAQGNTRSNVMQAPKVTLFNGQQAEFVFTTVTTTVSVPDGGTVLLGGIKRLREGRN
ncbi:MAG: hypothetical protein EBR23_08145, partial [Planctomycetia bacterium]|nr:hypothetical protein [Planctomycetia bacterium]